MFRKLRFSRTGCAGALAHEAHHVYLFRLHGATSGQAPELLCNAFQADVLERVGAPERDIAWVRAGDGLHFDLNRNGVHDPGDLALQDW